MRTPPGFLIVLLLVVVPSLQATAADGRILSFEGDVRVNGEQITLDTLLKHSDTVVTGQDASVSIVLSDNSVINLDGNSSIAIAEYSFDPDAPADNVSEIDVLAGSLRYVSGRMAKEDPQDVSFNAGNSTIGVRGTYISISVCPEKGCK